LFPNDWKVDDYGRLLVNAATLAKVKRGDPPEEIIRSWNDQLQQFKKLRASVLLYD